MEQLSLAFLFIILFILILVSAFFSGSEIGMMSLNQYRLKHLVRKKNKAALRVHRLLAKPEQLLGIILIGNTFANIIASAIATIIGQRLWGNIGVAISTTVLTLVILIFAEMTPKTMAAVNPQRVAFLTSRPLQWLLKLFSPLVKMVSWITSSLLKLLGINLDNPNKDGLSGEELRTVVHETGNLIPSEHKKMLVSILDLEKATVEDIMVPRAEVIGIDLSEPLDEILDQLETTQHTRLPVYRDDIENIEGVVHLRSILNLLVDKQLTASNLLELAQKPYFIPQGTPLNRQLLNFQQQKKRSGFIVDEYGNILGLVTLEDILEEIVGEFTTDMAALSKDISLHEDGSYVVRGSINLRELNRSLNLSLPIIGPRTLSGLITEQLGYIPPADSCVKINQYPMEILMVGDNMIKSIKIAQSAVTGVT